MSRSLRTIAHRAAGFTLVEILVVLVIVGIIVAFATLSLGNRALDTQLDDEGERLHQLFVLACEDAEVQGLELGWRYTPRGYEFLVLNQGTWEPFGEGPLRARTLPGALYVDLSVDGRTMPAASEDDKPVEPQVLLLSSGDASAFRLDLHARGYPSYVRIEGDALGRIRTQRIDQQ